MELRINRLRINQTRPVVGFHWYCMVPFIPILRSTSGATHADLLVAGITADHFPTCISISRTWLEFEQSITWTEDERSTIVPATRLYIICNLASPLFIKRCVLCCELQIYLSFARKCHVPCSAERKNLFPFCASLLINLSLNIM